MNKTQSCIPELKYRLLLLDIDGTLRPQKCTRIPLENVEEVQRIRRLGVQTAIATGRGRNSVPDAMLNGLSPDFWILRRRSLRSYRGRKRTFCQPDVPRLYGRPSRLCRPAELSSRFFL